MLCLTSQLTHCCDSRHEIQITNNEIQKRYHCNPWALKSRYEKQTAFNMHGTKITPVRDSSGRQRTSKMQWGRAVGLAARATVARRSSAAAPPHRSRTRRTAARPTKPPRWAFLAIATHVNGFRKLIHVDKKLPLGLEENKRSKLISTFPIMFYISYLLPFFLCYKYGRGSSG